MEGELPIPEHFRADSVGEIRRVPYQDLSRAAENWARVHRIRPSAEDLFTIALVAIDLQNTFCIPGFELYVGGRSGLGAVEDNRRLCAFLYRNLHRITRIFPTMDTHQTIQIFHSIYFVNDRGEHPAPFTQITVDDVARGTWKFNPALSHRLNITEGYGQRHLREYTKRLKEIGRYDLTVWPYHAMLGGIGHALVPAVEEAFFFHSIARCTQPDFYLKGTEPLTEHYSVLGPEVCEGANGEQIGRKTDRFLRILEEFDAVVVVGQAKSHCVAWTLDDLSREIVALDERLASKLYLLEDCTSPVVVPGVIDYTDQADAAFEKFARSGMRRVRSVDPIDSWPGIRR